MKKLYALALVALFSLPLLAANHLPVRPVAMPELQKSAAIRPNAKMHRAPQAVADMNFSATYVEAAYYGSYTEEPSDWVFFFVGNSDNILIYADVYGAADATHIDGTYRLSDGSIYEAFVVRAAGDTVDITSGSIDVAHNTDGTYRFTVNFVGGGETFTLAQDLEVDAYDYLYYMYYQYGFLDDLSMVNIYLEDAGANPNPGGDPGTDPAADYTLEPTTVSTVNKTMNVAEISTEYFSEYGDVDLYLYNVNAQGDTVEAAVFYVYVQQIAPDTYIPAGTYTFSANPLAGNVEASQGLVSYMGQYYVTPAYFAYLDAEGYIESVYYLVSGQLTLTKNGDNFAVQVSATSGLGSTVNISYTGAAPQSAVEQVEAASAQKIFRNGQVLIQKDGVRYNVLGQKAE